MSGKAGPMVVGAQIAAGHDGEAELVVQIRHENGVVAPVILDSRTGLRLLDGHDGLGAIVGLPWRDLLARTVLGET